LQPRKCVVHVIFETTNILLMPDMQVNKRWNDPQHLERSDVWQFLQLHPIGSAGAQQPYGVAGPSLIAIRRNCNCCDASETKSAGLNHEIR
jgi:hypothetical protein